MESVSSLCSWTKLFHPKGCQVTLPLPADPIGAFNAVNAALDAGWLVVAPGLDDGEEKEQVGYVLQGLHEHEGKATPFLLLYAENDALKWSFLKVYLNTDADVAAFEYASRMKLASIAEYVGNDKPQRGASAKTDRFIVAAPKPFTVVFKKNPKHDPNTEEGKLKPARIFVRWFDQRPATEATDQAPPTQQKQPQQPPKTNGASSMPKTAQELADRMLRLDANPPRAGLWKPGELSAHVAKSAVLGGLPADLASWDPQYFPNAVKMVEEFIELRKQADTGEIMEAAAVAKLLTALTAGKWALGDAMKYLGLPATAKVTELTATQGRVLMAKLAEKR